MSFVHLTVKIRSWIAASSAEFRIESGIRDPEWLGCVTIDSDALTTIEDVNEHLFRQFNRVTEEDCERLDKAGYHLPSLSVKDEIEWTWPGHKLPNRYRVAPVGFEPLPNS